MILARNSPCYPKYLKTSKSRCFPQEVFLVMRGSLFYTPGAAKLSDDLLTFRLVEARSISAFQKDSSIVAVRSDTGEQ